MAESAAGGGAVVGESAVGGGAVVAESATGLHIVCDAMGGSGFDDLGRIWRSSFVLPPASTTHSWFCVVSRSF